MINFVTQFNHVSKEIKLAYTFDAGIVSNFTVAENPGIQINILLSNILQQYIDIANINININIGFSKIAISISILNYCWQYIGNILIEQYIANFEQYIAEIEQYIAHFLVDEKIF